MSKTWHVKIIQQTKEVEVTDEGKKDFFIVPEMNVEGTFQATKINGYENWYHVYIPVGGNNMFHLNYHRSWLKFVRNPKDT